MFARSRAAQSSDCTELIAPLCDRMSVILTEPHWPCARLDFHQSDERASCYSIFMARYRCLFVNHADKVFGNDVFDADTDDEAIKRAMIIYRNGIGKGFELWREDSLVYAYAHDQNAKPILPAGRRP
jgi:hypothetical protein